MKPPETTATLEPMMASELEMPMHGPLAVSGQGQVVRLHGEHDLVTVAHLAASLAAASAGSGDLIVDLSDVVFFDASTIAVLLRSRLDLEAVGRHLRLRSPTPQGRRLLTQCGLTLLIESSAAVVVA